MSRTRGLSSPGELKPFLRAHCKQTLCSMHSKDQPQFMLLLFVYYLSMGTPEGLSQIWPEVHTETRSCADFEFSCMIFGTRGRRL